MYIGLSIDGCKRKNPNSTNHRQNEFLFQKLKFTLKTCKRLKIPQKLRNYVVTMDTVNKKLKNVKVK